MKRTPPAAYSWYVCDSAKEILIGPAGHGDCGDYRELGELDTAPDILAYWGWNAFPGQLLEEGRLVRDYFKLDNYKILYGRPST